MTSLSMNSSLFFFVKFRVSKKIPPVWKLDNFFQDGLTILTCVVFWQKFQKEINKKIIENEGGGGNSAPKQKASVTFPFFSEMTTG